MTELDEAMLYHIKHITLDERRPFSYRDFLSFEVNGTNYCMKHGTFRNKISKLLKSGRVEVSCRSSLTFYTLKGYKFGKSVTPNHTKVSHPNNPIYKMIQHLPFDKQSIHDIRLKFKVPTIWNILKDDPNLHKNETSKDLFFPTYVKENSLIRVTIHKTDAVSIILGCSLNPMRLETNGLIRFFTILARIEEQLRSYLSNYCSVPNAKIPSVPNYQEWIVTMWHFGRDALTEYSGEKYSITVGETQGILTRIYSKDLNNGKKKIRIETQEYPKKTVIQAVQERVNFG